MFTRNLSRDTVTKTERDRKIDLASRRMKLFSRETRYKAAYGNPGKTYRILLHGATTTHGRRITPLSDRIASYRVHPATSSLTSLVVEEETVCDGSDRRFQRGSRIFVLGIMKGFRNVFLPLA